MARSTCSGTPNRAGTYTTNRDVPDRCRPVRSTGTSRPGRSSRSVHSHPQAGTPQQVTPGHHPDAVREPSRFLSPRQTPRTRSQTVPTRPLFTHIWGQLCGWIPRRRWTDRVQSVDNRCSARGQLGLAGGRPPLPRSTHRPCHCAIHKPTPLRPGKMPLVHSMHRTYYCCSSPLFEDLRKKQVCGWPRTGLAGSATPRPG